LEALAVTDGVANIRHDRAKVPPWGLFGGQPGKPSRGEIRKPGEPPIVGTSLRSVRVPAGTRVTTINNGGGGYGDPLERDLSAIQWDLRQGYVSRAAAEADYGVVFDGQGGIDAGASERNRARLRGARVGGQS
jgi:N-methylhydantoinase B